MTWAFFVVDRTINVKTLKKVNAILLFKIILSLSVSARFREEACERRLTGADRMIRKLGRKNPSYIATKIEDEYCDTCYIFEYSFITRRTMIFHCLVEKNANIFPYFFIINSSTNKFEQDVYEED